MAIPLVPCTVMLLSTYVNAQTIFLLRDEDYFDVDEDKLGSVSSTIVLVSFPGAMIGTLGAGYLFDILGRKLTLFGAFFLGSIFVFCIPYTAPNIWPSLVIVRIFITTLFGSTASNPLLADYIHKDAIGKAAALVGLGFVVGEVLAMGILFNVTKHMNAYNAFMIVAIVGACCSFLFICLVKEPKLRKKTGDAMDEVEEKDLD